MSPNLIGVIILAVLAVLVYDTNRTPATSKEKDAPVDKKKQSGGWYNIPFGGFLKTMVVLHLVVMTIAFVCLVYVGYKNAMKNPGQQMTGNNSGVMMTPTGDIRPIVNQ